MTASLVIFTLFPIHNDRFLVEEMAELEQFSVQIWMRFLCEPTAFEKLFDISYAVRDLTSSTSECAKFLSRPPARGEVRVHL